MVFAKYAVIIIPVSYTQLLNFMVSAIQKIHAYLKEEDLQDGVCGYRELENWVRTFQAIKDVRRAAQVAVISKATICLLYTSRCV